MKKAVVLLSGGIDSTTVLHSALMQEYECRTITFRYGQKHIDEVACAKAIAARYKVPNIVVEVGIGTLGKSALTTEEPVPHYNSSDDMDGIDSTYVPGRNTVFLSLAMAYAETVGAHSIWIGANAQDYEGYPDCRPDFFEAFERMANLATAASVFGEPLSIYAPLLGWNKEEIISWGMQYGVDYSETLSCYQPGYLGNPCGKCGACILRAEAFDSLCIEDPNMAHR